MTGHRPLRVACSTSRRTFPTWAEVVLTLLAVGTISGRLLTDSVSVPLAVAGVLLFALALGPGLASGLGHRADRWFRDIGKRGRGSVIVLFFLAVVVLSVVARAVVVVLAEMAIGGMSL